MVGLSGPELVEPLVVNATPWFAVILPGNDHVAGPGHRFSNGDRFDDTESNISVKVHLDFLPV